MGTLVTGGILLLIVGLILRDMIQKKKAGKSPICGGDCKHCGGHCDCGDENRS